jgi:hypothetical protein
MRVVGLLVVAGAGVVGVGVVAGGSFGGGGSMQILLAFFTKLGI